MTIHGSPKGWSILRNKKKRVCTPSPKICYRKRKKNLVNIGVSSYRAYLASEDWKNLRDSILRLSPICILCQNKSSQVHHLSYDVYTLLGINTNCLIQLCSGCHQFIEIDESKEKRTLYQANLVLFRQAMQQPFDSRSRRWAFSILKGGRGVFTQIRRVMKREGFFRR